VSRWCVIQLDGVFGGRFIAWGGVGGAGQGGAGLVELKVPGCVLSVGWGGVGWGTGNRVRLQWECPQVHLLAPAD